MPFFEIIGASVVRPLSHQRTPIRPFIVVADTRRGAYDAAKEIVGDGSLTIGGVREVRPPADAFDGVFKVDLPCPDCGKRKLLGYSLTDASGNHRHTHYVCTYWAIIPSSGPCGWHGWSVPGYDTTPVADPTDEADDDYPDLTLDAEPEDPRADVPVPLRDLELLRDAYERDEGVNIRDGWGEHPAIERLIACIPEPDHDVSELPQWAQDRIAVLEDRLRIATLTGTGPLVQVGK